MSASKNNSIASEHLAQVIIKGMQEKKAQDITVLDLREIKKAVADFFIICTGTSDTHVDAVGNSIDEEVSKTFGENPWHVEGRENREWILLDYVDVVAHVFRKEKRDFYGLEDLWGDAVITRIPE